MIDTNYPENFRAGFAAVVGRPNVGKSTLINAFLKQKIAAVSPKPQTTRLNQLGILTDENAQIIFVDTPGIHQAVNELGEAMNDTAKETLADADVILWLVDASDRPHNEDRIIAKLLKDHRPLIQALNKIDLIPAPEQLEYSRKNFRALLPSAEQILISAQDGAGLDTLKDAIQAHLPEGLPFYPEDQITDLYEREIAADLIREAALAHLQEEVPHAIAVRIEEYKERDANGAYITATLFVERDSQKGIVIGKKGSMLKAIGTTARLEIEKMSGRKVFLDLRVKVKKNWRTDPNFLRRMGYNRPNSG